MTTCRIGSIAVIIAALALSACARKAPPSAGDKVDLGVVVDGQRLDEALSKGDRGEEILEQVFGRELARGEGRARLEKAIRELNEGRASGSDISQLKGLGGFSAWQLARRIVSPSVFEEETKGLIGDYLVFFNEARDKGYGHLTVDIETKEYFSPESYAARKPDRIVLYQWHLEVLKETKKFTGFVVHERNEDGFPDDPFPGTVTFPAESLDPTNPFSVWKRGLDHKLFAKGKGIVIHDVFRQIKLRSGDDYDEGPIVRLANNHDFYDRTEENCIDLLTRGAPPTYRIEFPEQSGYCLGRCANPDVFNSV